MANIVACPSCGMYLEASAGVAGSRLRCAHCQNRIDRLPDNSASLTDHPAGAPLAETPPPNSLKPGSRATMGADDLAFLRMDQDGRQPMPPTQPQLPGYEILEPIGKGGMGEIYKARQRALDRIVALKVIRPELLDNAKITQRFLREAHAAARLAHPNIVTIYDAIEANGMHFLVMEYIAGDSLAAVIHKEKRLPTTRICAWVRQAALGLEHLHGRGLVHRDIKPHNLLVNADRTVVKILDLGLARLTDDAQRVTKLTQLGVMLGTPAYFSPEQVVNPSEVDGRSDIYSLGCTLYQLLTAQTPFQGDSPADLAYQHLSGTPAPIEKLRPDMPAGLSAIVAKMMAKRPEDRLDARATAAELERFCKASEASTAFATAAPIAPTTSIKKAATHRAIPDPVGVSAEPSAAVRARRPNRLPMLLAVIALGAVAFVAIGVGSAAWWIWHSRPAQGQVAQNAPAKPEPKVDPKAGKAPEVGPVNVKDPTPAKKADPPPKKKIDPLPQAIDLPTDLADLGTIAPIILRQGDQFIALWQKLPVQIAIEGRIVAGKAQPNQITIQALAGPQVKVDAEEKVPAQYRPTIRTLLDRVEAKK